MVSDNRGPRVATPTLQIVRQTFSSWLVVVLVVVVVLLVAREAQEVRLVPERTSLLGTAQKEEMALTAFARTQFRSGVECHLPDH